MAFNPEIKFGDDRIEITGIPRSIYAHVRTKIVDVLRKNIPEMGIVEELSSDADEEIINVTLSNISGLDDRKSNLLDHAIEKLAVAFDRALNQLKSGPNAGFDQREVSTSKKPMLMFVLPGRTDDIGRQSLLRFLAKLKNHLSKAPYKLVPTISMSGKIFSDGSREVFVYFPEDRLVVAAMAIEGFFTKDYYIDLKRDLVLKLVSPKGKDDTYTIAVETDDS